MKPGMRQGQRFGGDLQIIEKQYIQVDGTRSPALIAFSSLRQFDGLQFNQQFTGREPGFDFGDRIIVIGLRDRTRRRYQGFAQVQAGIGYDAGLRHTIQRLHRSAYLLQRMFEIAAKADVRDGRTNAGHPCFFSACSCAFVARAFARK